MRCRQESDCRPPGHGPAELKPAPEAEEGEEMLKLKAASDCSMFSIMDCPTW